ncbi:MAG: hypothetical protein LKG20_07880 [Tetrasphaera jenkinsii]|jgi:adenylate kinase family enzyme|nr:hypothetical protein [Tetrasphaera jenkinsii]
MPLLSATDPLPAGARRFLVAGTSGSGKTTTAARIAATLGVRHTEMDGLFHGPDWTPRPTFVADVHAVAEADGWALEYQYSQVRPFLLERADVLVWLDLPVAVVMWQVTRRTIARRRSRAELVRVSPSADGVESVVDAVLPPLTLDEAPPERSTSLPQAVRSRAVVATASSEVLIVLRRGPEPNRSITPRLASPGD